MTATVYPPFGTYATPGTMSTAGKAGVLANILALMNLIPTASANDAGARAVTYAPDFDKIPPATAAKLQIELAQIHKLTSLAYVTGP